MVRYLHKEKFYAEHRAEDTLLIADVLRQNKPSVVVELGTYLGGIAALFADVVKPWNGVVHTFDIQQHFDNELLSAYSNLFFHKENVLVGAESVQQIIRRPGCLLYCDNGHKETELATYAPFMAVGNIIGCHDYDSEVRPSFAEPLLATLGFEKHRHVEFEKLASPPEYPISMTRFWKRVSG